MATVLAYWKLVLARAWTDTIHVFKPDARRWILLPVLFIIGSAVHWWRSGFNAMMDEVGVTLSYGVYAVVIAGALLLFVNFFVAPAHLFEEQNVAYADLRTQFEALERSLEPMLQFVYPSNDATLLQEEKFNHAWNVKIARLTIANSSKTKTIFDADITIVGYLREGDSYYNDINIRLSKNSFRLHPMTEKTFVLCFIVNAREPFRSSVAPYIRGILGGQDEPQIKAGVYNFKIAASGRDLPRLDTVCFLRFDSYDRVEFRQLPKTALRSSGASLTAT